MKNYGFGGSTHSESPNFFKMSHFQKSSAQNVCMLYCEIVSDRCLCVILWNFVSHKSKSQRRHQFQYNWWALVGKVGVPL